MKKTLLMLAAFACFGIAQAHAVNAPAPDSSTTSPSITATPAATSSVGTDAAPTKALTPQQTRMKNCAAQYHEQNLPKSQYKSFMGTCMKSATPASATSSDSSSSSGASIGGSPAAATNPDPAAAAPTTK